MRGEFKPIATAVPGIRICEHLPGLAARAKRLAIVRSMSHTEGNHLLAVHRVLTGQPSQSARGDATSIGSRRATIFRVTRPCSIAFGGGATVFPAACRLADRAWSRARSPGRVRTPAFWARATIRGSFGSTRTARRPRRQPRLARWPRPRRLHRRRHLLAADRGAIAGRSPLSISRMPRWRCSATARSASALDLDREDPRLVDRYGHHLVRPVAL